MYNTIQMKPCSLPSSWLWKPLGWAPGWSSSWAANSAQNTWRWSVTCRLIALWSHVMFTITRCTLTPLTLWMTWRLCRCWGWRHCAGSGDHWPGVSPPHCTLWSPPPCLASHYQRSHPYCTLYLCHCPACSWRHSSVCQCGTCSRPAESPGSRTQAWDSGQLPSSPPWSDAPGLGQTWDTKMIIINHTVCVMTTSPGHL